MKPSVVRAGLAGAVVVGAVRRMSFWRSAAALSLLLPLWPTQACARTLTVEAEGEAAFKSIAEAARAATAGDEVLVKPGTYHGQVRIESAGTAEQPIVFRSERKWAAVLQGSHEDAKRLNLAAQENGSGFFVMPSARYIVLDGFEIRGFYADGVLVHGANVTVRNCHIHNNGNHDLKNSYGYNGVFSSSSSHDNVYESNVIDHNGRISQAKLHDHGLYLCGSGARIVNNLIYANAGFGVRVAGYGAADGYQIINNTICFHMRGSAIALWRAKDSGSVRNCVIRSNILAFNAWYGIDFVGDDGHIVPHNIIFGNGQMNALPGDSGYDSNWQKDLREHGDDRGWFFAYDPTNFTAADNLGVDPRFVDPTGGDFHLRPGSPAIDRGVSEAAPAVDLEGRLCPQGLDPDIGAYEAG